MEPASQDRKSSVPVGQHDPSGLTSHPEADETSSSTSHSSKIDFEELIDASINAHGYWNTPEISGFNLTVNLENNRMKKKVRRHSLMLVNEKLAYGVTSHHWGYFRDLSPGFNHIVIDHDSVRIKSRSGKSFERLLFSLTDEYDPCCVMEIDLENKQFKESLNGDIQFLAKLMALPFKVTRSRQISIKNRQNTASGQDWKEEYRPMTFKKFSASSFFTPKSQNKTQKDEGPVHRSENEKGLTHPQGEHHTINQQAQEKRAQEEVEARKKADAIAESLIQEAEAAEETQGLRRPNKRTRRNERRRRGEARPEDQPVEAKGPQSATAQELTSTEPTSPVSDITVTDGRRGRSREPKVLVATSGQAAKESTTDTTETMAPRASDVSATQDDEGWSVVLPKQKARVPPKGGPESGKKEGPTRPKYEWPSKASMRPLKEVSRPRSSHSAGRPAPDVSSASAFPSLPTAPSASPVAAQSTTTATPSAGGPGSSGPVIHNVDDRSKAAPAPTTQDKEKKPPRGKEVSDDALPEHPDPALKCPLLPPQQPLPAWPAPSAYEPTMEPSAGPAGPAMDRVSTLGAHAAEEAIRNNRRGDLGWDPSKAADKPSGLVRQLDSHGFECARYGCEKRTNDWDGTSTICLRCGPYTPIRYCSEEHMLQDIGTHCRLGCPAEPYQAPTTTMPRRLRELTPVIMNKWGPVYPEHTRQVLFNATSEHGGYALFRDYQDWLVQGSPDVAKYHETPAVYKVWLTVTFENDPELQDNFDRVLHSVFFDHVNVRKRIMWLARMIRMNLRQRGLWDDAAAWTLHYQFMLEFLYPNVYFNLAKSSRDPCFTEWTGQAAILCPNLECQAELNNDITGDVVYGHGLKRYCEAAESQYWILRAWRVWHPEVKNVDDRIKGVGFEEVPENQVGKLRVRGEGWDGYGNEKDERLL